MLEETLNKALDYTRGNNTYLQCVNNNLEHAALAVRNMESVLRGDIQDLRHDLQASTAMNINAIQGMAMGISSDIRASTYAVVASQNMLADTFKQGFNSVNNTINLGLGLVGNKIDVLSKDISSKLYEIQDVLEHPRLTETRELYHRALGRYKKGFYEEALEDCLAALEIDKTDYISWYLLGLIYLFGAGENGNVINLDKAEEAFANAAKYIKPDIPKSNETQLMASEIFYHLGFTRLAKSNDFLIENKIEDSNTKLLEAQNATAQAYSLSKENLIAGYEYAKELHFLGKDSESLILLEDVIRAEQNFAIKALNDKNLESLWFDIEKIVKRLKLEACKIIRENLENYFNTGHSIFNQAHEEMLKYINNKNFTAKNKIIDDTLEQNQKDVEGLNRKIDEINLKYVDIENKDYFFVLNILKNELPSVFKDFEEYCNGILTLAAGLVEIQIANEQEKEQEALREKQRKEQEERSRQEEERIKQQEEERKRYEDEQKRIEKEKRIENEKFLKRGAIVRYIVAVFIWIIGILSLPATFGGLLIIGASIYFTCVTFVDGCFLKLLLIVLGIVGLPILSIIFIIKELTD